MTTITECENPECGECRCGIHLNREGVWVHNRDDGAHCYDEGDPYRSVAFFAECMLCDTCDSAVA